MKTKLSLILWSALLIGAMSSCNKEAPVAVQEPDNAEIILGVQDDFDVTVETKTTAVTTVPSSLYWGATTGTDSETKKWDAVSASVSSNKINTGKYQTSGTPTAYNYYIANQQFTVGASTTMTVANNNTDIICGRTAADNTLTPSVTLNHIFSRTGTLTANAASSYTISAISWKIVGKSDINGTAGTYNLTTNTWTAASTKLTSETAITSSSDMYLIPGTYTIKVTFTLTKGDWTKTYTKSADVTLVKGKVNNISATFNGEAQEIVISVSVTAWGTENHTSLTWS